MPDRIRKLGRRTQENRPLVLSGNIVSDSAPSFGIPIGYAGGLQDPATGLVRFGMRDYDPVSGRWCARDPITFGSGQGNLYAYCGNCPVGMRDSSGLMFEAGLTCDNVDLSLDAPCDISLPSDYGNSDISTGASQILYGLHGANVGVGVAVNGIDQFNKEWPTMLGWCKYLRDEACGPSPESFIIAKLPDDFGMRAHSVSSKPGYVDVNFTAGFIVGFTTGVLIDRNGEGHFYFGIGVASPQLGVAITGSPLTVSEGWSVQGQFSAIHSNAVGYSFKDGWFAETGVAPGPFNAWSGSAMAYYVF